MGRGMFAALLLIATASSACRSSLLVLPDGGADLAGRRIRDLSSADLTAADLAHSDLSHSDLSHAGCPCAAGQTCVQPACCPDCAPVPDGGPSACPPGSSIGTCPVGGDYSCITPCEPPPPFCADQPCTDATAQLCGPYGGMCVTTSDSTVEEYCYGCF